MESLKEFEVKASREEMGEWKPPAAIITVVASAGSTLAPACCGLCHLSLILTTASRLGFPCHPPLPSVSRVPLAPHCLQDQV